MAKRIVVADDDPFIRRLMVFTLKKRGFQIFEAGDGDTALALIRQELPDLVVLDVLMPGLSGLQVTQALVNDPATLSIPVLIVSASAQASEIEAGIASGAASYLTKPFEPHVLGERVQELLDKKETSQ